MLKNARFYDAASIPDGIRQMNDKWAVCRETYKRAILALQMDCIPVPGDILKAARLNGKHELLENANTRNTAIPALGESLVDPHPTPTCIDDAPNCPMPVPTREDRHETALADKSQNRPANEAPEECHDREDALTAPKQDKNDEDSEKLSLEDNEAGGGALEPPTEDFSFTPSVPVNPISHTLKNANGLLELSADRGGRVTNASPLGDAKKGTEESPMDSKHDIKGERPSDGHPTNNADTPKSPKQDPPILGVAQSGEQPPFGENFLQGSFRSENEGIIVQRSEGTDRYTWHGSPGHFFSPILAPSQDPIVDDLEEAPCPEKPPVANWASMASPQPHVVPNNTPFKSCRSPPHTAQKRSRDTWRESGLDALEPPLNHQKVNHSQASPSPVAGLAAGSSDGDNRAWSGMPSWSDFIRWEQSRVQTKTDQAREREQERSSFLAEIGEVQRTVDFFSHGTADAVFRAVGVSDQMSSRDFGLHPLFEERCESSDTDEPLP